METFLKDKFILQHQLTQSHKKTPRLHPFFDLMGCARGA